MNKGSFPKRVAEQNRKPQLTRHLYNKVLNELLTGIRQELAAGRKVSFLGFGTFYTRIHKGGKGINFKTKKPVAYKAVCVPAFRPGSLLKKAVRKNNRHNIPLTPSSAVRYIAEFIWHNRKKKAFQQLSTLP